MTQVSIRGLELFGSGQGILESPSECTIAPPDSIGLGVTFSTMLIPLP